MIKNIVIILAVALGFTPGLKAQVVYTSGTYLQDFDSLANTGPDIPLVDNVTLLGWSALSGNTLYSGTGAFTFTIPTEGNHADAYDASIGDSNAGELYSFGSLSATDRALGSVGSGTPHDFFYILQIQNGNAFDLTSFTLTYDGEQWRRGANPTQRAESLLTYYRIGGTAIDNSGTWLPLGADFVTPEISDVTGVPIDGNTFATRNISATVESSVPAGESVWFAFVDPDNAGSDHGVAVDNVRFTVVPEPSSIFALIGGLSVVALRRRRA